MYRCHWIAYCNETNRASTKNKRDGHGSNFKHPRDERPFARVSYFNYVSNFKIIFDFYMVKFFQW